MFNSNAQSIKYIYVGCSLSSTALKNDCVRKFKTQIKL